MLTFLLSPVHVEVFLIFQKVFVSSWKKWLEMKQLLVYNTHLLLGEILFVRYYQNRFGRSNYRILCKTISYVMNVLFYFFFCTELDIWGSSKMKQWFLLFWTSVLPWPEFLKILEFIKIQYFKKQCMHHFIFLTLSS